MQDQLAFQQLDSYQVAKEIAKLVHLAKIRDTELPRSGHPRQQELLPSALRGAPERGRRHAAQVLRRGSQQPP